MHCSKTRFINSQELQAEEKQSKSAAAEEKIMAAEVGEPASNNNVATPTDENEVQNGNWPVPCVKCNESLATLENFNEHMIDHWRDDKCCPVCGILSRDHYDFKKHLSIHTGEKPFVCEICSSSFGRRSQLKRHIEGVHEGVRKECEVCGTPVWAGTLARHMRGVHGQAG